ncbi:MAG: WYL domain-containing protein [Lachnospiraceae bacterium]|nr:WYL domain-containing protein [Lachnospiraceae bacterium]
MVQTREPKKMLILYLLDILQHHTDSEHGLSTNELVEKLNKNYNMTIDRKAIKANINNLCDAGYDIEWDESTRRATGVLDPTQTESIVRTNFRLNREFEDCEIRYIIDLVVGSNHISPNQKKDILTKLKNLSSVYFAPRVSFTEVLKGNDAENQEVLGNLDLIDKAIEDNKKIVFNYCTYDFNKKLHVICNGDKSPRTYIGTPVRTAIIDGTYYLIFHMEGEPGLTNFHMNRIKNLDVTDESAEDIRKLKDFRNGFDLDSYVNRHINTCSGESGFVTFKFQNALLGDVVDTFGDSVSIYNVTETDACARVSVSYDAMKHWAMSHCSGVKIMSPESLVHDVRDELLRALGSYTESRDAASCVSALSVSMLQKMQKSGNAQA